MVGLESTVHQRAVKTALKMSEVKDHLIMTENLIDDTMATLDGLGQQAEIGVEAQYKQFAKKVAGTQKQCKKLRDSAETMQVKGDEYFMAWEKELESFENPDIRARSEERRATALESFQKMTGSVQGAIESIEPYLGDMKDIQTYLNIDLTPAGIASISTQIQKTKEKAKTVHGTIDRAIAEIDRVAAEMPAG